MRFMVLGVVTALASCIGGNLPCTDRLDGFSCPAHSSPACDDPSAEADPICPCDAGFANFDQSTPECEDPSPEYASCCECMAGIDEPFRDPCLSTTASQCVDALEAGAEVSFNLCTASEVCPGACANVNCGVNSCVGY